MDVQTIGERASAGCIGNIGTSNGSIPLRVSWVPQTVPLPCREGKSEVLCLGESDVYTSLEVT